MATKTKKVEKSEKKKELKVVEPMVEEKKNFLHHAGDGLNALSEKIPTGAKKVGKVVAGAALFLGGLALGSNLLEKGDSVDTDATEENPIVVDLTIDPNSPSNDDIDTAEPSAED